MYDPETCRCQIQAAFLGFSLYLVGCLWEVFMPNDQAFSCSKPPTLHSWPDGTQTRRINADRIAVAVDNL